MLWFFLPSNGLPHLFTNQTGSFFCSLLISVLEKKEFKKLLKSISPKLRELLAHPIANFVVQDVVEHLLNSKQVLPTHILVFLMCLPQQVLCYQVTVYYVPFR